MTLPLEELSLMPTHVTVALSANHDLSTAAERFPTLFLKALTAPLRPRRRVRVVGRRIPFEDWKFTVEDFVVVRAGLFEFLMILTILRKKS